MASTLLYMGMTTATMVEAATKPQYVKGIYVTGWTVDSKKFNTLINLADTTEINTFVVDVKDDSGRITPNLERIVKRLDDHNIYSIARIVLFKDPTLAAARPDLAVHKNGKVWVSKAKEKFMDPYSKEVWKYNIDIAKKALAAGFDEIQWDYIRFPDTATKLQYPNGDERTRRQVISDFLKYSVKQLPGAIIGADVFGYTTSVTQNDLGIGQYWEDFEPKIDVVSPMVYPSHYYQSSFGVKHPNSEPYKVVYSALKYAIKRSGQPKKIRPWLQSFTLGKPRYEAYHIRAQIKASEELGLHEWYLWNARNVYQPDSLKPE